MNLDFVWKCRAKFEQTLSLKHKHHVIICHVAFASVLLEAERNIVSTTAMQLALQQIDCLREHHSLPKCTNTTS